MPSSSKDEYKLLNQFLSYNLFPRNKESQPDEKGATWMVAFMDPEYVYNRATHLYALIIDFQTVTTKARLPFPCMITRIFRDQLDNPSEFAKKDKLDPDILNQLILTKSSVQTTGGPIPPILTKPKKSSTVKELLNLWLVPECGNHHNHQEGQG